MVLKTTRKAKTSSKKVAKAAPGPSISELRTAKELGKKQYKNAKRTDVAYEGYIKRGKVFLDSLVASCRLAAGSTTDCLLWDDLDVEELGQALDNPPNRYSAFVVESWIVQKCLTEDLGESTADGIHAAFIRYWNEM